MLTLVAFLVAIAVLVTVHEWGHYATARAFGVKVLRFSVGFGPRVAGWRSTKSGTEYAIGLLPIGGYVKMLDEQEAPVALPERSMAFNNQPLRSKAAIVAAGPIANLFLAVILYSMVNWLGVTQPQAILSAPPANSILAVSGFLGGEKILRAGFDGDSLEEVVSFEGFRWWLAKGALEHRNVQVEFRSPDGVNTHVALLMLSEVDSRHADAQLLETIGVSVPFSQARLGNLMPDGAAVQAHLMTGDVVLRVDEINIVDAIQLRELIRASGHFGVPKLQTWSVLRNGEYLSMPVAPKLVQEGGQSIGRVGAMIGAPPAMAMIQFGLLDGISEGIRRTWETSALTLRVMGQIVIGQASLKNLSGPVSIADYAGKSAAMGFTQFLVFLALMSVSLGVLNLLPLPLLDGGHLMYYLWEALSGKPVGQLWTERLQKLGLVILLMLMSVAIVNDLTRLLP
jgi:regulator of sigma E protease